MRIWKMKYLLILAIITGVVACKDDDDNGEVVIPQSQNRSIFNEIAFMNNAKINLGELAYNKGADSTVKSFGQMMMVEYQDANKRLDSLAKLRNIPNLPTVMKSADIRMVDSLNALTGASFDSAYIKKQISLHTLSQEVLTSFNDSTKDSDLKEYVTEYLSNVEVHIEKADSLATALADTTGSGTGTGDGTDTGDGTGIGTGDGSETGDGGISAGTGTEDGAGTGNGTSITNGAGTSSKITTTGTGNEIDAVAGG